MIVHDNSYFGNFSPLSCKTLKSEDSVVVDFPTNLDSESSETIGGKYDNKTKMRKL